MGSISEHLKSPQFTDAAGDATGPSRVTFVVAPGRPRWLGYAFYLGVFVVGGVLALGVIDTGDAMGRDLIQIIGIVAMLGALYGCWEVWRGRAPSFKGVINRVRKR